MENEKVHKNTFDDILVDLTFLEQKINEKAVYKFNQNNNDIEISGEKINNTNYKLIIKTKDFLYSGEVTSELRRLNGLNRYSNGDVYYGNWENDIKNGTGTFIHKDEKNNIDIFIGKWDHNKRKFGLYLWGKQENNTLDKNNFDFFYGNFEDDLYSSGLYATIKIDVKGSDNSSFYLGKFKLDKESNQILKDDDNAIFYNKSDNRVFQGKFTKDVITTGRVLVLEKDTFNVEMQPNQKPSAKPSNESGEDLKKQILLFKNLEFAEIIKYTESLYALREVSDYNEILKTELNFDALTELNKLVKEI